MAQPLSLQDQSHQDKSIVNGTFAHILIVDDDLALCRLVARYLTAAGHHSQSVNTSLDAKTQLASGAPYDLILCDINMPGGSGMDLLPYVKTHFPDMAIVMLTGMDNPETAQIAFTLGAHGYLLKPFEKNELLIQVASALQRRSLEIENRHYREHLESKLAQRTASLKASAQELKDTNTALVVLLKKSNAAKDELQKNISSNMCKVIQPYLRKLSNLGLTQKQRAYIDLIESSLADMVSPMIKHLGDIYPSLTPAEMEIVHLIRQGRRNKDIADTLNLSINTIMTHRYRIRKKLGLLGQKVSLHAALHDLLNSDVL